MNTFFTRLRKKPPGRFSKGRRNLRAAWRLALVTHGQQWGAAGDLLEEHLLPHSLGVELLLENRPEFVSDNVHQGDPAKMGITNLFNYEGIPSPRGGRWSQGTISGWFESGSMTSIQGQYIVANFES